MQTNAFQRNYCNYRPCYIIKKNPIEHPNEKDFGLPASIISKPFKDYSTPEELAYKAALDYYFSESRKYDDWDKCDFGENMEVLGIHNYISESTIYGVVLLIKQRRDQKNF